MAEEMRFHLELRAAEHSQAGMSEQDARDAARRWFGNRTSLEEHRRTAIGSPSLETLGQDARYVLRALRHSPRFSATYANAKAPSIANNSHPSRVVILLIYSPIFEK